MTGKPDKWVSVYNLLLTKDRDLLEPEKQKKLYILKFLYPLSSEGQDNDKKKYIGIACFYSIMMVCMLYGNPLFINKHNA